MAKRKQPTRRPTPKKDWRVPFLEALARTGSVVGAAAKAKVHRSTAYELKSADPAFAALWAEAEAVSVELMEAEARRRAVEGTLRPVFQGGKKVGEVLEYSDTLIIFLLKARRPDVYRDHAKVVVSGDPGAPVKHEHSVTVTGRIEQLAAAFAGAADREEAGGVPGHGP